MGVEGCAVGVEGLAAVPLGTAAAGVGAATLGTWLATGVVFTAEGTATGLVGFVLLVGGLTASRLAASSMPLGGLFFAAVSVPPLGLLTAGAGAGA